MNELLKYNEKIKLFKEGKKQCVSCRVISDIGYFAHDNKEPRTYRSRCKKCYEEYIKKQYQTKRDSLLKENGRIAKEKLKEVGLKRCPKCRIIKKIDSEYYIRATGKPCPKCIDCISKENKNRVKKIGGTTWKLSLREDGKKWCNCCQQVKPLEDFNNNKNYIDGKSIFCKLCKSRIDKQYREAPEHRQKRLNKKKIYYERTKDTDRHKENMRKSQLRRDYKKERETINNDEFRLFKRRLRSLTNSVFARINKSWAKKDTKSEQLLGANFFVVKEFIERQFISGMSWDNYGSIWHLDHIIPLHASNENLDNLKRLCFYKNLTPMFCKDNLAKSFIIPDICTLWSNHVVPYKETDNIIEPIYDGVVGQYKEVTPIGKKFNFLTVISDADPKPLKNGWKKRMIKCKCDCGVIKDFSYSHVKTGKSKSCGCLQKKMISEYFKNRAKRQD